MYSSNREGKINLKLFLLCNAQMEKSTEVFHLVTTEFLKYGGFFFFFIHSPAVNGECYIKYCIFSPVGDSLLKSNI